jgi:hypothetical protein
MLNQFFHSVSETVQKFGSRQGIGGTGKPPSESDVRLWFWDAEIIDHPRNGVAWLWSTSSAAVPTPTFTGINGFLLLYAKMEDGDDVDDECQQQNFITEKDQHSYMRPTKKCLAGAF